MQTSKPHILLFEPLLDEIEIELDRLYSVHRLYEPRQADNILQHRQKIRAVVTGGATGLPREWQERLTGLEMIAVNGVGVDRIDLDHARAKAIEISRTPGALTADVADYAIALVLCLLRRVIEGDRLVRSGQWSDGQAPGLGGRISSKRLGILGFGAIGREVAHRAGVVGLDVGYWNRSLVEGYERCRRFSSPAELAQHSDILVVCVAANDKTRAIVSSDVLTALGPEGVLVNVSRGSTVDEAALIDCLRTGTIAAAGLDVFENEPMIDKAFLDLPNVILSPHQASATRETRLDMGGIVLRNLAAHFRGEVLPDGLSLT